MSLLTEMKIFDVPEVISQNKAVVDRLYAN